MFIAAAIRSMVSRLPRRIGWAMPSSTAIDAARRIFGSSPSGYTTRFGPVMARLMTPRITPRARPSLASRRSRYSFSSTKSFAAPLATAAQATAGATHNNTRGSNGKGIR